MNSPVDFSAPDLLGTCVNAFDEDGQCVIDALPWSDVTEFAQAVAFHGDAFSEGAVRVTYLDEFDIHFFWAQ